MSVFYDHLIEVHSVRSSLENFLEEEMHVQQVLAELDAALHHVVLEVIFSHLPEHAHETFVVQFREDPTSHRHLIYLRQYVPEIDRHIQHAAAKSKQKFLDSIHD